MFGLPNLSTRLRKAADLCRVKYDDMGQSGSSCGLAPRSANNNSTNNLPPVLFHQVHGDNITLLNGGAVARRSASFCKAITFSNRPIKVGEKVCIKFLEICDNWSGAIRFGFTCNDPSTLRGGLPRYACPELAQKPGYWAKALGERFAEQDTVLHFYVTATGDVHFGINGEDKGFFFSGVETRGPLWALVDVYGNTIAIEMVDPRAQLNNSRRSLNGGDSSTPEMDMIMGVSSLSIHQQQQQQQQQQPALTLPSPPQDVDLQAPLAAPRFQPPGAVFNHLAFHRTRGKNIRLSNDRTIASRSETEFSHGYVFTQRPVMLGERIVVQVLNTEPAYAGALAFGLTSCDPAQLQSSDLPDDADLLLDRSEYWVVTKDVASCPQRMDELTFCVTHKGEVQISRNGGVPVVFMYVDQSLQLWAFVDVYGSTQKIRLVGSMPDHAGHPCSRNSSPPPRVEAPSRALRVNLPHHPPALATDPHTANSQNNGRVYCPPVPPHGPPAPSAHVIHTAHPVHPAHSAHPAHLVHPSHPGHPASPTATAEVLQLQQGGGTVLVVNLPPQSYPGPGLPATRHSPPLAASQQVVDLPPTSSGTLMSTYSDSAYIEPVSRTSYSTMDSVQQWADARANNTATSDCSICYERTIDSVLYSCGHMCMCYECAVQQWKGKGGGHCPLCRAVIRDVIRTYKS